MHDFEICIFILIHHIEYIEVNDIIIFIMRIKEIVKIILCLKRKPKYFTEHVFKIKNVNPWVLSTFPFEITHIFFCHVRFSFKY